MSDDTASTTTLSRPPTKQNTLSFARYEPPEPKSATTRERAGTVTKKQTATSTELLSPPDGLDRRLSSNDIFSSTMKDDEESLAESSAELEKSESLVELPIEIRSLTERFLESLKAPVHATPVTTEGLADLFQEFYVRAQSHIATHIAALASKLARDTSPAPSFASGISDTNSRRGRNRANSKSDKGSPSRGPSAEQQMLTAIEITDRKKARRELEMKRVALEEAAERTVCETVYNGIWRHRGSDDRERDAKLCSRIASLSLLGIGWSDLHESSQGASQIPPEKQKELYEWLEPARVGLEKMDEPHYPLGKLRHLTAAHRSIVDALSKLFPSSSSADEILPTLIFALMTLPPDNLNIVSNLRFIQRFRSSSQVDGEAAYCLVNLEAAVSFLENVDLSTLRIDQPSKPAKSNSNSGSQPPTPVTAQPPASSALPGSTPSATTGHAALSPSTVTTLNPTGTTTKPPHRPGISPQSSLSKIIQAQNDRIESGRETLLKNADQAFEQINSSMQHSFKFLFGRLQEHRGEGKQDMVPKTLEEARKLVSTPPPDEEQQATATLDIHEKQSTSNKVLELVGGRSRDRSADSARSTESSSKRLPLPPTSQPIPPAVPSKDTPPLASPAIAGTGTNESLSAFESMRNLGNTLNPLNKIGSSFGMIRGLGRNSVSLPSPSLTSGHVGDPLDAMVPTPVTAIPPTHVADALKQVPPVEKFVKMKDASALRIGEVEELLREYQKLVAAVSSSGSSS